MNRYLKIILDIKCNITICKEKIPFHFYCAVALKCLPTVKKRERRPGEKQVVISTLGCILNVDTLMSIWPSLKV